MSIPKSWSYNFFLFSCYRYLKHGQLAASNISPNILDLENGKTDKIGNREVFLGAIFQALPATFEFGNPLLYHAVRRCLLSKCGLHVLVDLLGCFALLRPWQRMTARCLILSLFPFSRSRWVAMLILCNRKTRNGCSLKLLVY